MKRAHRRLKWLCLAVLAALGACTGGGSPSSQSSAAPVGNFYLAQLTADSRPALPTCTAALAGTTAYVTSPPGIWTCQGSWAQIPCTKALAGAVAYASSSKALLACVAGAWTPITLPTGATGPTGPAGPAGPAGAPGSLVAVTPETAGAHCAAGGQRIDQGVDKNADGVLQASEVQSTTYVCNGANGTNGATGPTGPQGPSGANGVSSVVRVVPEAEGSNCAAGGVKLSTGADSNGNGVLDPGEETSTSYVCNGVAGAPGSTGAPGSNGSSALVSSVVEPAGANCEAGGFKLSFGGDSNGNGVLDPGEVTGTAYVCNGTSASTGCGGAVGCVCTAAADCTSHVCASGLCQLATCTDHVKNNLETDVDCGGACPKCAAGSACTSASDCGSGVCAGGVCLAPSCSDNLKNQSETDVDCGGSCAPCSDGKRCLLNPDCASGRCESNACVATTCNDRIKDGTETSVDCGGGQCPPCHAGATCTVPSDCAPGTGCCNGACLLLNTLSNCGQCDNFCSQFPNANTVCDPTEQCNISSCNGDNYDVNNNPSDGCERLDPDPPGHTPSNAGQLPALDCFDSSTDSFSGTILSDNRPHFVAGFNSSVGAAPDFWAVAATGGQFCFNDYRITVAVTGSTSPSCYKFTVQTDRLVDVAVISASGTATLSQGSSAYSSNSRIQFEIEKICSLPFQEAVTYSVSFHL